MPLYEAAYAIKADNKRVLIRRFLIELSTVLPAYCAKLSSPNAGISGPWFKAVEALGIGSVWCVMSSTGFYHVAWRINH